MQQKREENERASCGRPRARPSSVPRAFFVVVVLENQERRVLRFY
jgi:hypothetical protein